MATYKSKQELEGKTLKEDDKVTFTVKGKELRYSVYSFGGLFLHSIEHINNIIFTELGIDAYDFVENLGVIVPTDGVFPPHCNLEDLTKTVLAIFSECEKHNKPKGVVDLSIIPEWKVGDVVYVNSGFLVIRPISDPNHAYPLVLVGSTNYWRNSMTVYGVTHITLSTRNVLTANEALLCFGLTPPDEILALSAKIKAENEPEIEEELVSVQLTKSQYERLINLLNE
jgi:hypothetical protein